jgi:PKD repeat protein
MPTGYHIISGQGTRSIMVQIDEYAESSVVSVVPSNICTEADPIKANIVIRKLPKTEAGVDFITKDCATEAQLNASKPSDAIATEWKLVSGYADFADPTLENTKVSGLMYGDNVLSWRVDDGYCVGHDIVTVTNYNPGITEPEFSEITICEDFMTLRAPKPQFGMGRWELVAGDGEIENPNSNETLISGLSNKRTNIIRWEVYSQQCANSIEVEVVSHDLHKLVDAGEDGISTTGTHRLSARVVNDAHVTGTWTVVAGAGEIENPHNPNTVVTGLATGINTLRWTISGYECEAYDEIKIRMVDEPIASFNIENAEGCEPLTVQFTNTTIGKAEYKWEFGDGSTSDLRSPVHIFEKAGKYTVKMTAIGEKRTDYMTGVVNVLPSPEAAFSVAERQLYVPNAEAHFYNETEGAVQHYWEFGDGGSSNKANPVYTYVEDGLYDVTYIVSDINLCSDTLVMEDYIKVGKDSYLVFPTAFTPNVEFSNGGVYSQGERRLDVFYPIGRNVDTYKLEIYSSWGNKVFESNDQNIGWDGYYLGKCAAQGAYFYKAEGRFKDGTAFQYSGNLMLIR